MTGIYVQYKEAFQKLLSVDSCTLSILSDEFERSKPAGIRARMDFWVYLFVTIVTNLLFPIKGISRRLVYGDDDFIFVSCPDPIFRTKNIELVAKGLKYTLVYLPNFHIGPTLRYASHFQKKGKAVFLSFSISDVLKTWKLLKRTELLKTVKREQGKECYAKLRHQLFTYLVYDYMVRRTFGDVGKSKARWIFEHQKFYFIPSVHLVRENGKETIMLQHGSFFKPSFNYYPLYCDKALCCSEREKQLYVEAGIAPERIEVFGAPLQTLSQRKEENSVSRDYLLLVLLSAATEEFRGLLKEVLVFVKKHFPAVKVLVRPRPRSRESDLRLLGDILDGYDISAAGTPMDTDLERAEKVVTFSEDAVFHLVDNSRPFLIIVPDRHNYPSLSGKCADAGDYNQYLASLLDGSYAGPFTGEEKKAIIGETDIETLNRRLVRFVESGHCD